MKIDCTGQKYDILNKRIRASKENIVLENCLGQRFIAAGADSGAIEIDGICGNATGAYLNGAELIIRGNAQDAVGDTMNGGRITIYGSCGDAAGYAMRGGEIYIRGDVGYRAGIHMKAYRDKVPVLMVGGRCGSFLGEYQAGGIIIVLGLGYSDSDILGYFCGTGMHGGRIFVRCDSLEADVAPQVSVSRASTEDMELIAPYIDTFCASFGVEKAEVCSKGFCVLAPNTKNPYRQLYVQN